MTSTVSGRRYRLPDWLGGHEVRKIATNPHGWTVVETDGHGQLSLPDDFLNPVGLDMAEPPDGTVVRVEVGASHFIAERDDAAAEASRRPAQRWFTNRHPDRQVTAWDELTSLPGVSITVLEPQDDTLRAALVALHADLAAKAETLQRVAAGTGYAYCRDALGKLLGADGFHINGREEKPETVTFPWELTNISGYRDRFAKVEPLTSSVSVAMGDDQGSYVVLPTPDEARAMAAAILAAADIAETWPRTRRATDATT